MRRVAILAILAALALAVILPLRWLWPEQRFEPAAQAPDVAVLTNQIEQGRYLALAGDCMPCHTQRGGAPYAGGRAIPTPFGTFYSPNITPDREAGIGRWNADDFWQALHQGRSRDGAPLYPVFPYTNYTRITRADADALFAYMRSVPAAAQPRRDHELRFPYQYRVLLLGWRALYFRPGVFEADAKQGAEWNRGAYLVRGLGHCSACHEARNALGAIQSRDNPAGGLVLSWYAPSLHATAEAGVQGWQNEDVATLLRSGKTEQASMLGPMAEVVYESLQHLQPADIEAMALYLSALPERGPPAPSTLPPPSERQLPVILDQGAKLYAEHCASCHGDDGKGRPPAGPALAGNRAVNLGSAVNLVRVLRFGGYPPGTADKPRPFGMPPFEETLSDAEIAAVLSYLRKSWGNDAAAVSAAEVSRHGGGPLW